MRGALAHCVDTRIRDRLHRVGHNDAALAPQPRTLGQIGVGADAGSHDDELRRYLTAVFELHGHDPPVGAAEQGLGLGRQKEAQATLFQAFLQHAPRHLVELALHQPRGDVHHADLHTAQHQAIGSLQPEQAAADDHGVTVGAGRFDHRECVGDIAVSHHAIELAARQRRDEWV